MHPRPPGRHIGIDSKPLILSFELKFFVPACFQNRVCLSVCLSVRLSVCLSLCPHPEKRNHLSFVNISPTLVIDTSTERSSRVLHHGNPKIWYFFKKVKFEIWLLTKSWNHISFVNISPTLVIDASTERCSWVLHHGNQKIWFFFSKKFAIEFDLYFDLCWRAETIQVGLNMHLCDVIGDASSSLWGSTSSLIMHPHHPGRHIGIDS